MRVTIDEEQGVVELDQSRYALEIYNSYRDQSVRIGAVSTPMSSTVKLSRTNGDPEYMANKDYRGAVGSLLYLCIVTRPDLSFAVKELSRVLDSPGPEAWKATQHLLEHVHNTHHMGIRYTAQ